MTAARHFAIMVTSYQSILDAIDAEMLTAVDKPGSLTVAGRTIVYRSLTELSATREYYKDLLNQSTTIRDSIKFAKIKSGAP